MKYNCPKCAADVEYPGSRYFPFCTKRCQLMDLGAWADEEYAIVSKIEEQDIDAVD